MRAITEGASLLTAARPGGAGKTTLMAAFWEADGQGGHRLVFRWNAKADTYEPTTELHDLKGLGRYRDFLGGLLDEGEITIEAVRRKALEFCRDGQ